MTKCRSLLRWLIRVGLIAGALHTAAPAMADATDPRDLQGTWITSGMTLFLGVDLPYTAEGQNLMAERIRLVKAGRSMALSLIHI